MFLIKRSPQKHQEFVSANTGNDLLPPETIRNCSGYFAEHCIPEHMAIPVVDLFKIVNVDQE